MEPIKVYARVRKDMGPHDRGGVVCHEGTDEYGGVVEVCRNSFDKPRFGFSEVFDGESTQEMVYLQTAKPLIDEAIRGHQCTLMCYGQSGSGKTYTLSGEDGITIRSLEYLFSIVNSETDLITIQNIQIYNEEIQDLTCPGQEQVLLRRDADGVTMLQGANCKTCTSLDEANEFIVSCQNNRSTALTRMNATSSRSHSCLIIRLRTALQDGTGTVSGSLTFVDLAGSERVSKTHCSGDRLQEAKFINQSLSHLGNVVSSLSDAKHSHIPYRDSILTKLLQDSLGGSGKTSVIVTMSPTPVSVWESLSTCQFGQRAMKVKSEPKVRRQEDWRQKCIRLEQELLTLKNSITEPQTVKEIPRRTTEGNCTESYTKLVSEQFESRTKNAQLIRTVEELETNLRAAQRQHKSDLLDREETIQQLQEQLSDTETSNQPTDSSNTQTDDSKPDYETMYETLLIKLETRESQLRDATSDIDQLRGAESRLQKTVSSLQKDNNSKQAYIVELERTLDRMESVLEKKESEYSIVATDVDAKDEKIAELEEQVSLIKTTYSEEVEALIEENEGLRNSKNNIKQRLVNTTETNKKEIRKLTDELGALHESSTELKDAEQTQTATLTKLRQEQVQWNEEKRKMESNIDSLNLVADKLASQCTIAEEKLQKRNDECTSIVNATRDECSTRVRNAVNELNSSESYVEAEYLRREMKRLTRENCALTARIQEEIHKNKKICAMKEETEHRLSISLSQSLGLG